MNNIEFEILLLNLFYSGLVSIVISSVLKFKFIKKQNPQNEFLLITFLILLLIVTLDNLFLPIKLTLIPLNFLSGIPFVLIGILVAFLLELLIGLIARARVKGSFSNLEITSKLSNNGENGIPQKQTSKKLVFNLLVIGVSLLEEIIFRGFVLQYLLSNDIPLVLSIAISSIAFGVNHFFRGPLAIIQKTNAGAVFGVLTILGSFSLYIPIATHIGENYVILAFKEIKKRLDNRETRND